MFNAHLNITEQDLGFYLMELPVHSDCPIGAFVSYCYIILIKICYIKDTPFYKINWKISDGLETNGPKIRFEFQVG